MTTAPATDPTAPAEACPRPSVLAHVHQYVQTGASSTVGRAACVPATALFPLWMRAPMVPAAILAAAGVGGVAWATTGGSWTGFFAATSIAGTGYVGSRIVAGFAGGRS